MPQGNATTTSAKRRPRNAAARAQAATAPRAPTARSRVTNGRDVLPGIDGRSLIARRYRDIIAQVALDQGGPDRMSEARVQLTRRFAGLAVLAENMEAHMVGGNLSGLVRIYNLAPTYWAFVIGQECWILFIRRPCGVLTIWIYAGEARLGNRRYCRLPNSMFAQPIPLVTTA